jgi:hypothetical protein
VFRAWYKNAGGVCFIALRPAGENAKIMRSGDVIDLRLTIFDLRFLRNGVRDSPFGGVSCPITSRGEVIDLRLTINDF